VLHSARRRYRCQLGEPRWIADEHCRLGITQEIVDLGPGVSGVQRQERGARAQRAEKGEHRLDALFHLQCHPVARPDAERGKGAGILRRAALQLSIGDRPPLRRLDEGPGGIRRMGAHEVEEMIGHQQLLPSRVCRSVEARLAPRTSG
jgi:hypothetical protein